MDQSRSRNQSELNPKHVENALIIERPDLASPTLRLGTALITLAIWFAWLFSWIPLAEQFARLLGMSSPTYLDPGKESLSALDYLLNELIPLLALLFVILVVNYVMSAILRRVVPTMKRYPLYNQATPLENPESLTTFEQYHAARIVSVEHDSQGNITKVSTNR